MREVIETTASLKVCGLSLNLLRVADKLILGYEIRGSRKGTHNEGDGGAH